MSTHQDADPKGTSASEPDPAMHHIILVESDPRLREWCALHLATQGYDVAAHDDARQALEAARARVPDLLVIATDLPGTSAFALAAAVRSNVRTATTPIVFLVPVMDPSGQAQASTIDAARSLTKPTTRQVFLETISSCLSESTARALPRAPAGPAPEVAARTAAPTSLLLETKNASLLFVTLRNLISLARALSGKSLDALLLEFVQDAREAIVAKGGWVVRTDATGMQALFENTPGATGTHSARAIEAALHVVLAARRLKQWAETALPERPVPNVSVGCGVHSGEVVVARLSLGGQLAPSMAGPTVEVASRLNGRAKGLGWGVAVSETAALLSGQRFTFGRRSTLTDTDSGVTIPIVEAVGFNPGTARPGELVLMAEIREAMLANTMLSRLAGDVDPDAADKTIVYSTGKVHEREAMPQLPERRIVRRIGQSQRVAVFDAVHLPTNREEAVKTVLRESAGAAFSEAYLDRYRTLSALEQRNVVHIHEVGEAGPMAYVAAEWLAGGALKDAIRRKIPLGTSLNLLAQMCLALGAIHDAGWFHGTLRAEHFLFRNDKVLVLADFNVTARVEAQLGLRDATSGAGLTEADWTTGTRADFRALGLILLAMLSDDPATVEAALSGKLLDAHAPSRLPLPLAPVVPCLEGLLGTAGRTPFERSEEVLVEVLALKDIWSRPIFAEE
jgi:DNA-binding response OmpR family regulator